ncbi:MAG: hypothetical protein HC798_02560 [Polaribacter sp.]|nr:hypothetical protein [Polaribacter sp.]
MGKTSYVNQDNGKTNTLKVKKENGFYKFYINNNFVYQTDFEAFFGNEIGYVVFNNQEIAVDYLRVKYISSSNNNNNTYVSNTLKLPVSEQFNSNANGWYTGNF